MGRHSRKSPEGVIEFDVASGFGNVAVNATIQRVPYGIRTRTRARTRSTDVEKLYTQRLRWFRVNVCTPP